MGLTDEQFANDPDPTLRQIEQLPRVQEFPVVGQYILCSKLGAGGAGAVFMGYHAKLQRPVAIKIMNPSLVEHSESAVARFEREAILSSQFRSDHIVPVTDAGTVYGTKIHYLIMDLIDGENAEERVQRRSGGQGLDVAEALTICLNATRGLIEAHAQSVIHRDLKPSNIMISAEGEVRLADMGIATSLERPNLMLTQADESLGTPQYMSPEQIRGNDLDGRTDVYAMGISLYHLLTGIHPFEGPTAYAVMKRVESESLPDVRTIREDVPQGVANLIKAATQSDAEERIPSAEALVSRLQAQLNKLGGEVSLADPMAGSSSRDLFVALASEDLQDISKEVEELQAREEGGRRGVPAFIVVGVILLTLIGAVGIWIYLEGTQPPRGPEGPTLDQLIIEALEEDDYPEVVELLPQAMTSVDISESARQSLLGTTAEHLKEDYETPTELLEEDDKGTLELLKMLAAEKDETFRDWVVAEAGVFASKHQWSELTRLLDSLEGSNAPSLWLLNYTADMVARQLIERVLDEGWVEIDEPGIQVLLRLGAAEATRMEQFLDLAKAISADPVTRTNLLKVVENAKEIDAGNKNTALLKILTGVILDRADAMIKQNPSAETIGVLNTLYESLPAEGSRIVQIASDRGKQSLQANDWEGGRVAFEVISRIDQGGQTKQAFGTDAVKQIERAAKIQQPMGVVSLDDPGEARALLYELINNGIRHASRWYVELLVTWDAKSDRVGIGEAVQRQERDRLLARLNAAINESTNDDATFSRLMFIRADIQPVLVKQLDNQVTDEQRGKDFYVSIVDGVKSGNADCATRLIRQAAHRETLDELFGDIKKISGETVTWDQIKRVLDQAIARHTQAAGNPNQDDANKDWRSTSPARVYMWRAVGEFEANKVKDPKRIEVRRAIVEWTLKAHSLGYQNAASQAETLHNKYLEKLNIPLFNTEQLKTLGLQ